MELKDYQQRVLDTDAYLDELRAQLSKTEKIREALKDEFEPEMVDFPNIAWKHLKEQDRSPRFRHVIPYSGRKDGMDNDVPNICLKVPTGGRQNRLQPQIPSLVSWDTTCNGITALCCGSSRMKQSIRKPRNNSRIANIITGKFLTEQQRVA